MTHYGEIDEVWFDGACGEGPNGKKQEYDFPSYFALIRELKPHALIAISGPDIRWVGNESGVARENESSVVKRDGRLVWHPAECDVSIRPGWFYHASEDAKVKSLATLADIYFKSVGRNSVLLLNIPPDRRGRIAEADAVRLKEFDAYVAELDATDFVTAATVTASSRRDAAHHERLVQDRDLNTSWTPGEDQTTGYLEFDLGQPRTFNVARIQEDISLGERVQAYHVEILDGGQLAHRHRRPGDRPQATPPFCPSHGSARASGHRQSRGPTRHRGIRSPLESTRPRWFPRAVGSPPGHGF